jgi:YHS domain-containing protein
MGRLFSYLLELAVFFVSLRFLGRALRRLFGAPRVFFWTNSRGSRQENSAGLRHGEAVRDPVCGMFVSTELSYRLTRGTETLHFCSPECLTKYQKGGAHAAS